VSSPAGDGKSESVRQSPYIQLPSMVVLISNIAYLLSFVKII
jgi:hypothetical protein